MDTVHIAGRTVDMSHQHGMWRAVVDGVHFCGQTQQELTTALGHLQSIFIRKNEPAPPPVDPVEALSSILRTGRSLEDRQEARRLLLAWAAQGNEAAQRYAEQFRQKPEPSFYARDLARRLNKTDFSDVTHMELVENVDNIVVRNHLILELSNRISLS